MRHACCRQCLPAAGQLQRRWGEGGMDYPYDVGSYSRKVTTASADAQRWFDRGLNWCFGYHHEEAVRCFGKALEIDPSCAMAHWGIGYAAGPNYNYPWELQDPAGKAAALARAHDAARAALALAGGVTAPERALIEALPARYPQRDPIDDQRPWNDAFADAMRLAHRAIPTTSICAPSSPKRSSTVRPGACGTCAPANPRPAPPRSRPARCSKPRLAICPGRRTIPACCTSTFI